MSDKSDFINAAIREKREREKGCEYCNDYQGALWTYRDIDNSHQRSNFCPMCGRELNTRATSGESEGK